MSTSEDGAKFTAYILSLLAPNLGGGTGVGDGIPSLVSHPILYVK